MNTLEFLKNHFRYCDGQTVELRAIRVGGGVVDRLHVPLDDLAGVDVFCNRNRANNVYFGVGVRDGVGGKAENITQIPCTWVDIDFKDINKRLAWKNFKQFPFKPSVFVKSGGGIHCYFYLSEPAEKEDFSRLVDANRRIAQNLGGDLNACDIARVMRLPGTTNHKYNPPKPCEVIDVEL